MVQKRWATQGTGYDGRDSYFMKQVDARNKAKSILISGEKRIVHILRLATEMKKIGQPVVYAKVETWGLVNGVPKRVRY